MLNVGILILIKGYGGMLRTLIRLKRLCRKYRIPFRDYTWKCPRCGRIHKYRMTYYCNEIFDKDSKEDNKALVEGKKSLWSKA